MNQNEIRKRFKKIDKKSELFDNALNKLRQQEKKELNFLKEHFHQARKLILIAKAKLSVKRNKLRNRCKNKFHPRFGDYGQCPDCGYKRSFPEHIPYMRDGDEP